MDFVVAKVCLAFAVRLVAASLEIGIESLSEIEDKGEKIKHFQD